MADDVVIKMNLNLQNLSINTIAIQLWESPAARKKVKEFFAKSHVNFEDLKKFSKVIDQVLEHSQVINLPKKVLVKIRHVIRLIGEKVFTWTWNVINDFGLELKYAEKKAWTCYGTVDEVKTFQLYWQNDPGLLLTAEMDFKTSLYGIACRLGQTDIVSKSSSVMKKILKKFCEPMLEIANINDHFLIGVWICCYLGEDIQDGLCLYENVYFKSKNPQAELLLMCARAGYFNAFKYFASKTKKDRNKHFFLIAKEVLLTAKFLKKKSQRKLNYIEIIIFLISNMSVERRNLFLAESIHYLFSVLINSWPYEESALQLINYILPFLAEEELEALFVCVTDYSVYNKITNVVYQVLQKILESTSRQIKRKRLVVEYFAHILLDYGDLPTIKIYLKDPDVITFKNDILEIGEPIFKSWVKEGNFARLNQFIQLILSEDEAKKFKSTFNDILEEFILADDIESAEKLLDFMADSTEERFLLKMKVNPMKIMRAFYENDRLSPSDMNRLLHWQFDGGEEQIKKIKILLRSKEFIREEFYKIWGANCTVSVDDSKAKTTEFLKFFDFDPDELKVFKKDKIIQNESFLDLFTKHLALAEDVKKIDELLKFCCVPFEDVQNMKGRILDVIERWIEYFAIDLKSFKIAFAMVNWLGEEKKIVGEFINSYDGREFCRKMMVMHSTNFCENFLMFINFWVKPYGDYPKILNHLCGSRTINERKLKALFEALEKKGFISRYFVEHIFLNDSYEIS